MSQSCNGDYSVSESCDDIDDMNIIDNTSDK